MNTKTLLLFATMGLAVIAMAVAQPGGRGGYGRGGRGPQGPGGPHGPRLDTNGDGVVTYEEASVLPFMDEAKYATIDTDGDGVLTREELRANRPGPPKHEELDANKDGVVSYEEASVLPFMDEQKFTWLDKNQDGVLDDTEGPKGPRRDRRGGRHGMRGAGGNGNGLGAMGGHRQGPPPHARRGCTEEGCPCPHGRQTR